MAGTFADDRARAALRAAVEAVEASSGAEVVVAVRRQSSSWLHVNLALGAVAAFAALAYMLFADHTFAVISILVDPFVVGLAVGLLVELTAPIKRLLTPSSWRRRVVEQAARAAFVERGIHGTSRRTGIFIYASWLERRAIMVADIGVLAAVPPSVLAEFQARLDEAMAHDGDALAEAVRGMAGELGCGLRRADDDINELPDDVDAHVGRRRGASKGGLA